MLSTNSLSHFTSQQFIKNLEHNTEETAVPKRWGLQKEYKFSTFQSPRMCIAKELQIKTTHVK